MLYINYPSWIRPEIIPGFFVRWYALMYIIAFSCTYYLVGREMKRRNIDEEIQTKVFNMIFWGIIGLLIGARLGSQIIYNSDRGEHLRSVVGFLKIFWPFDSDFHFVGFRGMSYHGGVLGALVGLSIYSFVKKVDFMYYADIIGPAIPLGYTFGRIGNFLNGELYGKITASKIGILFPTASKVPTSSKYVKEIALKLNIDLHDKLFVNLPRFPSQLFESFGEGLLLWVILWVFLMRKNLFKGALASMYLMSYAIVRFIVEYFRGPDEDIGYVLHLFGQENAKIYVFSGFGNISMGQILSFFMFLFGLVMFLIMWFLSPKKNSETIKTYKNPKDINS